MPLLVRYSSLKDPFTRLSIFVAHNIVCELLIVNPDHFITNLDQSNTLVVMTVELFECLKIHLFVL